LLANTIYIFRISIVCPDLVTGFVNSDNQARGAGWSGRRFQSIRGAWPGRRTILVRSLGAALGCCRAREALGPLQPPGVDRRVSGCLHRAAANNLRRRPLFRRTRIGSPRLLWATRRRFDASSSPSARLSKAYRLRTRPKRRVFFAAKKQPQRGAGALGLSKVGRILQDACKVHPQ
jgi:hypothetical protein